MEVLSVGVYWSAFTTNVCWNTPAGDPAPARLKYEWFVRLTTVSLSVVAR